MSKRAIRKKRHHFFHGPTRPFPPGTFSNTLTLTMTLPQSFKSVVAAIDRAATVRPFVARRTDLSTLPRTEEGLLLGTSHYEMFDHPSDPDLCVCFPINWRVEHREKCLAALLEDRTSTIAGDEAWLPDAE